jgi:hypothetical protein
MRVCLRLVVALAVQGCQGSLVAGAYGPDTGPGFGRDGGTSGVGDARVEPRDAHIALSGEGGYWGASASTPLDARMVQSLRARIGAARDTHSFMRLGNNLSHPGHLLGCADSDGTMQLDGRDFRDTLAWYRSKRDLGSGQSPFTFHIGDEFENLSINFPGEVSRVSDEFAEATNPALALVMFGEIGYAGEGDADRGSDFHVVLNNGAGLLAVVDRLLAGGTVPLLRTIPPVRVAGANGVRTAERVWLVNGVIRAVAAARDLPLLDLFQFTRELGPEGFWDDGSHLSAAADGPCDFRPSAMIYGDNVMSLRVLEQLDRVRGVLWGSAPLDDAPSAPSGSGSAEDPIVVPALPFADARPSAPGGLHYRLSLEQTTKLRVLSPLSDARLSRTGGGGVGPLLELELPAGSHEFVLETDVQAAIAFEPCAETDATCIGE